MEEVDSLQKVKMIFFAKPHVGLVKHVEGVYVNEVREAIGRILEDTCVGGYRVIEERGSERRVDVVASLTYRGSELRLWITITERSDVGCIIEIKVYHGMEESAEADEYLTLLSQMIDEKVAKA